MRNIIDKKLLKFILVGIVNTLVGTAIMFGLYNLAGCSYWVSSAANLRYRKHTQLRAQQEVYVPASGADRSERIAIHRKHSGVLSAGIWDR